MPRRQLSPQELTAIEDEIVAKAPPGLTDEEFDRYFGPTFANAQAIAEHSAAPLQGSSMRRALSGIWEDANPVTMASGLWNALPIPQALGGAGVLEGPATFLSGAARASADQWRQAQTAPTLSEKIGHYGAALIPVVGPAAADAAQYGVETGDVAGMIGRGIGQSLPFDAVAAAKTLGRATSRAAQHTPGVGRVADRLEAGAVARQARAMSPEVGPNKVRLGNKATEISPQLVREPGLSALSRGTFAEKVGAKLDEASTQLDAVADARGISQLPTAPILAQLDAAIAAKIAEPIEASRRMPSLRGAGGTVPIVEGLPKTGAPVVRDIPSGRLKQAPAPEARPLGQTVEPAPNASELATLRKIRQEVADLGDVASYESVRRIRQAWDQVAKVKFLPATAQDALRAMGDATGAVKGTAAIREALAQADPKSAAAYQRFHLFKSARDVVQAAEEADRVRPNRGRGIMARTTGAVIGAAHAGPVGAGIGALVAQIVDRAAEYAPSMQIVVARRMAAVADALRRGQTAHARAILERVQRQIRPVRTTAKLATQSEGVIGPAGAGTMSEESPDTRGGLSFRR